MYEETIVDQTPTAQLLSKHDEVNQIDQALLAQKEEFQLKMEALQLRREQLNRKEDLLKQNLTKFDKFLRENESKKGRAIRKAAEERRLKEVKENEINDLRKLFKNLQILKDKQHSMIHSYVIYQKYLDSVVEVSGNEYHEPRDIIARQETLNATNADLIERCRIVQDKTDHYRAVIMCLTPNNFLGIWKAY